MWGCIAGKQVQTNTCTHFKKKAIFRLLLAAMHFNENFGQSQAVTKLGRERMKIVFPKQKQGEFTPKIVSVAKTYTKFETNWLVYYC